MTACCVRRLWRAHTQTPHKHTQAPTFQTLNAVSALRVLRAAIHNKATLKYLSAVGQITPVLMHFGALVLCFVYFSAAVSMEVLAAEPAFKQVQTVLRMCC